MIDLSLFQPGRRSCAGLGTYRRLKRVDAIEAADELASIRSPPRLR